MIEADGLAVERGKIESSHCCHILRLKRHVLPAGMARLSTNAAPEIGVHS
jgi:hypothetical protein